MSKFQKGLALILTVFLFMFVLLMLLGMAQNAKEVCWEPYVVRPGDTLYEIAAEVNAENPEKFSYEVCKKNGIPHGGLIFPGDVILIYGEVVE